MEALESRRLFSATPSLNLDSSGFVSAAVKGSVKLPYSYYVTGNAGNSAPTLSAESAGLALAGGGLDVDEVFKWMGAKANGGDFLVIRATGTNAYNTYIDGLVPSLDSVATLIIPDRAAAMHTDVKRIISEAESIFIAGGDQGNYITFWNETPVEQEIYNAVLRNVPIGGTSAGLAVLGEIDFSAVAGSITSPEALSNPLGSRIANGLDSSFLSPEEEEEEPSNPLNPPRYKDNTILKYMDDLITDSHFMQRDREGRLLTFMAYMDANTLVPGLPRGIGVNEQTALLIEHNGMAKVVGNSYNKRISPSEQQRSVYLFQGNTLPSEWVDLTTGRLNYSAQGVKANYNPLSSPPDGDSFSLDLLFDSTNNWSHPGLDQYNLTAINGVISVTSPGTIASNFANYYDPTQSETDAKRRSRLV